MSAFDEASHRYLLDTNIISALMRAPRGPASVRLAETLARWPSAGIGTSVVVDCELRFGLQQSASARLQGAYDTVMATIDVRALEPSVSAHYAELRSRLMARGTPIGPNNAFIAAHALALEAILVTDNEEKFRRVPGLQVENWLR